MLHLKGDLVGAFRDNMVDVIVHQVNCQGKMGSGIAGQIRKEFPKHYEDYLDHIKKLNKNALGTYVGTCVSSEKHVIALFSQDKYGYDKKLYTSYAALSLSLAAVAHLYSFTGKLVGIPAHIGCGLGGGDWNIVRQIILDIETMYGVEFHCYEL